MSIGEMITLFIEVLTTHLNIWVVIGIFIGICILGFGFGRIKLATPILVLTTGIFYILVLTGQTIIQNTEYSIVISVFCGLTLMSVVALVSSLMRITQLLWIAVLNKKQKNRKTQAFHSL